MSKLKNEKTKIMDFFKSERQNISIKNNKTTKITYLKKIKITF